MSENTLLTTKVNSETGQICGSNQLENLSPADIKRNVTLLVLLGSAYGVGSADIALAMQPFLVYLEASNSIIGIITGAQFMALFGIFFSPWITRHFRRKKKYFFYVNIPYVGMFLLIGLAGLFAEKLHISNQRVLTYVFLLTLANCFLGGFCSLPSQEFLAACIPMSHRGRQMGYSFSVGGLASVCIALLGGWILSTVSKPAAFGYVIVMGWAIMQSGYFMAVFAKEIPASIEKSPPPWSVDMFKAVWQDKCYVRFLLFYGLSSMVFTNIFMFVNIYGFHDLKMPAATTAIMAIVSQITRITTSIPFGHLVDKLTPKRVFPYSFILASAAIFMPVVVPNQYGVYMSIIISTAFSSLSGPAQMALLLGIPSPENRAGYYSVQLIVQYAAICFGTIALGCLCDIFSYYTIFIIMGSTAMMFVIMCKYLLNDLPDGIKSYS